MGMPHTAERWTADMVPRAPGRRKRYEVVDGELLVTPAPSAAPPARVSGIHARLWIYLQGSALGEWHDVAGRYFVP